MNKEELITYKQILESKEEYTVLYMENGNIVNELCSYSMIQLLQKKNSQKAVNIITENFKALIEHLVQSNIGFTSITMKPHFGILVSKEEINEEDYKLPDNIHILNDLVFIDICNFQVENNDTKVSVDIDKIPNYQPATLVVSFREFRTLLEREDLSLDNYLIFDNLKQDGTALIKIAFAPIRKQSPKEKRQMKMV